MKYFLLLFLFLSVGWLHCRSQRVAVSVNALPAIDGAFEAGVSYAIGNKSTVELTGSLRPWKRATINKPFYIKKIVTLPNANSDGI